MSDEVAKEFASQEFPRKDQPEAGRSLTLSVTLHPNGQVEFSLPTNAVLAYGMLGLATAQLGKLALQQELQQAAASRGGGIPGLLNRMNGGKR